MTTPESAMRALATDAQRQPGQVRELLILVLAVAAGSVDAISWLVLGRVFSAFVTGNLLFVGLVSGGRAGPQLVHVAAALTGFAVGAGVGSQVMRSARREQRCWPSQVSLALCLTVLLEAGALAVWRSCAGHPVGLTIPVLVAMLAMAVRIQSAAVASLRVPGLLAIVATAVFGGLMDDAMRWPSLSSQATRMATVACALFAGAALGGLLVDRARLWAPFFPVCLTVLVCVVGHVVLRDKAAGPRSGVSRD